METLPKEIQYIILDYIPNPIPLIYTCKSYFSMFSEDEQYWRKRINDKEDKKYKDINEYNRENFTTFKSWFKLYNYKYYHNPVSIDIEHFSFDNEVDKIIKITELKFNHNILDTIDYMLNILNQEELSYIVYQLYINGVSIDRYIDKVNPDLIDIIVGDKNLIIDKVIYNRNFIGINNNINIIKNAIYDGIGNWIIANAYIERLYISHNSGLLLYKCIIKHNQIVNEGHLEYFAVIQQ